MEEQEPVQPPKELHIVQERKRFIPLCCFGVTWVSRGWQDPRNRHKLKKGEHPSTKEYRRVRNDHPKAKKDWEWGVIVDETDTDPEGWQYGRCLWLPKSGPTSSLNNKQTNTREHMLDCVKQRRWVLLTDQEAVIESGKRGSVSVLTPVELRQYRAEKQRRWEEGMGDVWKLLDELDKEADFRSQATALLDPVALQVVAARHSEIMRAQKAHALEQCSAVRLLEEPQWPITGLQDRVTHGVKDALPKTEAAHDFAHGIGELVLGISRLPHHVSLWSHNINTSIQQQVLEHKRRNNWRKMAALPSHQELIHEQEPLWLQQHYQRKQQRDRRRHQRELEQHQEQVDPHSQPHPSSDEASEAPKPQPTRPRQQQPQVSPFREASLHPLPQARVRIQYPDAAPTAESTPPSAGNALHITGSKETSADDTTTLSGKSSPPKMPGPQIPHSVSAPHLVFMHKQRTPYSSTDHLEGLGETMSGPNVVLEDGSARPRVQASTDHGLGPSTRSQPVAYVEERETPIGVSDRSTATSPTAAFARRHAKPGHLARGLWRQGLMQARKALDLEGASSGSGHHRQHHRHARGLEAFEHDYDIEPFPKPMQLSLPELQCATGHALAIYGDLEEPGEYGICLQTYCGAIKKYTGVPESDVVMTVWRSQVFEPGHYVAIDRKAQKIVVSVRGTMETVDTLTDVVGRPVPVCFQGLRAHHKRHGAGVCHAGMLGAATSVFVSASAAVVEAHQREPKFDILVTGHSLGGGAASVLAILLRGDSRLPRITRSRLRAVCLAPAASISGRMSRSCQHFMVSIIYGSDIVPRVDLGSACNFVREVAAASPLRRLMIKLGKGIGMPWSKISDSAGTASALGGTVAMDSAASTMTGKGYAGTRFVGAAAHDAMRQHSDKAKEGSRELNEGEGVEDSAGIMGGARRVDAQKDQPLKEQQNGPAASSPGTAAASHQPEDKVVYENGKDENGWLEGGRQHGAAVRHGNEAEDKYEPPKGQRVDKRHEQQGESVQSAGHEHGKGWSQNGHTLGPAEVKIQLGDEEQNQGQHHHRHHHNPQHEAPTKQQSTTRKPVVNLAVLARGARTGLAAVKEEAPGIYGRNKSSNAVDRDNADSDNHPRDGSEDGALPRNGSNAQQGGVRASQDLHRGLKPNARISRSSAVHNRVEGEDDEPLLRPMVPPGVVYWLLRAPVPQLTVASQRSSAVLLTPRESVNRQNSQASGKFARGSGNGAPSPSGQRPYSRAETGGSNGPGGAREGADAPSPSGQRPYSRAGTGGSNGAGVLDEGASAEQGAASNACKDVSVGSGAGVADTTDGQSTTAGKNYGGRSAGADGLGGAGGGAHALGDAGGGAKALGGAGGSAAAPANAAGGHRNGVGTTDGRNDRDTNGGTAAPAPANNPDTEARDQQHHQQHQQQQLQHSPSPTRQHQQEGQLGQPPSLPPSPWLSHQLEGHQSLPTFQLSQQLPGQHSLPSSVPQHPQQAHSQMSLDKRSKQHKEHLQQRRQSSMLGVFSKLGSSLEVTRSKHASSGRASKPTLFSKPSLFSKLSHNSVGSKEGREVDDHREDEEQKSPQGEQDDERLSGDEGSEVEESLGSRAGGAEDDDVSQLVLLRVEDNLIAEGLFDQMLLFRQAITDHLPMTYLKALRALLAQQRAELTAAHMANKRIAPPQGRLDALRRTFTQKQRSGT